MEIFGSVPYYGAGHIIREYARFPRSLPLPVSIQHGWSFTTSAFDARDDAPENWYWSRTIETQYKKKYPHVRTRAVGAPFLYLLRNIRYSPKPLEHRKGSIVFPSHSAPLIKMDCDFDEYARMLLELPSQFKPITVCMYYLDMERGLEEPFRRAGFEIVTNGTQPKSADFLCNFIKNSQSRRFAFANQMTSALLYASALGLQAFYYGPKFSVESHDPGYQHLDYNLLHRKWEETYEQYFKYPDCDQILQHRLAMSILGYDCILTRRQMFVLLWRLVFTEAYLRLVWPYKRRIAREIILGMTQKD